MQRRSIRVGLLLPYRRQLLGALAPILTIPDLSYELAWLGTWGALFVLALGWLWVNLTRAVQADLPPDLAPLRERPDAAALRALRVSLLRSRPAWLAAAGIVLALALASTARPAPEPSSGSLYGSAGSFIDKSWLDRPALRSWDFAGAVPHGWSAENGAFVQSDSGDIGVSGLYVRSAVTTQTDALQSPAISLPAGTYDLLTTARSLTAGFRIVVRAPDGSELAGSGYSSQQPEFLSEPTWLRFKLASPTTVHIAVSSWSAFPTASAWILWKMRLLSASVAAAAATRDAGYYTQHATTPEPPTAAPAIDDWSFTSGMPPDWGPVAAPIVGTGGGGAAITTALDPGLQIWSPPLDLTPGRYRVQVLAAVPVGGIELGAVADSDRHWLGSGRYWRRPTLGSDPLTADFTLRRPTVVRVALSNWAKTAHISMWTIGRVTLYRER